MIDVKFVGKVEDSGVDMNLVYIPAGFGVEEFWMSETPVTVRQWCEVMGLPCGEEEANLPKTEVNIEDITEFLQRLTQNTGKNFRLPTEIEWCRAVGEEPKKLEDYAVFGTNQITAVKTKLPNEYGLYDMRGLVYEWVSDWENYVARGGSWFDYRLFARAVYRSYGHPANRFDFIGFRVVHLKP